MTRYKGIDVSGWQDIIDWKKVKEDGIDFAILRAGGADDGLYKDSKFDRNYVEAKKNGIKVGAYYFNSARLYSEDKAKEEANHFLSLLEGKTFDYPVYADIEVVPNTTRTDNTSAAIIFCDILLDAGYDVGIYASDISGFSDKLDWNRLGKYEKWIARWGSEEDMYHHPYQLWQYTSDGSVNGISGRVDMDYSYVDYSGSGEPTPVPTPSKSIDELAQEVIDGLWGNGDDRRSSLFIAGYDYDVVQDRVNEILLTPQKKTIEELAEEVWDGLWGVDDDRKQRLTGAGFDYEAVQEEVNRLAVSRKSVYELAREVFDGLWGNGDEREQRLTETGYNYDEVQDAVNRMA